MLLNSLAPRLHEGVYVYSTVAVSTDLSSIPIVCSFREEEGLSIILLESDAMTAGFPILFRAAWITLTVNSALGSVGLTAAVSNALSDAGISCNVIAASHHDHLFVPVDRSVEAMAVLRTLAATESLPDVAQMQTI